jgi:hypothetical protein
MKNAANQERMKPVFFLLIFKKIKSFGNLKTLLEKSAVCKYAQQKPVQNG